MDSNLCILPAILPAI